MTLNNDTAVMTVFVPVNAAFDVLAAQTNQTLGAILAQTDMLKQVWQPTFHSLSLSLSPSLSYSCSDEATCHDKA